MLSCLAIHSSQKAYHISYDEKVALESMKIDGGLINEYFENKSLESLDEVLIVGNNKASTGVMEVYLDIPYRVCEMSDIKNNFGKTSDSWCDLDITFYCVGKYKLDCYSAPEYIIVQGTLDIPGYVEQNIGLNNFNLYRKVGFMQGVNKQ